MRRLPPLRALRCFESTARLGSVSAAARELGVSHSAVSQQIAVLESHFGRKLFVKTGRGLTVAEDARLFVDEVRLCFDRISIASEQLATRSSRRVVTVNSTPSFAMRWLIQRLPKFQGYHYRFDVRVATSPTDTIAQLAEPYDVIVRREPMSRPEHTCVRFLDDVSTPVASPKFLARQRLKTAADLRNVRLLHLKSRPEAWRTWFDLNNVKGSPTVPGALFDHFFLALEAAINGLGVALCPTALIQSDLGAGTLVSPLASDPVIGAGFHALYRTMPAPDRATLRFLDWLVEEGRVDASTAVRQPG
jgi:LysR family transcriptional regulator, glycine cleavage system transcriptional activator